MKKKNYVVWGAIYGIVMVCLLIASVLPPMLALRTVVLNYTLPTQQYIYVESPTDADHNQKADVEEISVEWFVRAYEGRIGLFDTEGRLVDLIDTYVKALPEADQRLLGEGFAIQSKLEWMAIVEDYSH